MAQRSLLDRIMKLRRERAEDTAPTPGTADSDERIRTLEARIAHLESVLEGLQDAVHREAVRNEQRISELQRRTQPQAIAQALSADARKRGI
jgi:uncharacterized coiled-coil protein SlyX